MATKADIVADTLRRLRELGIGDTATADDSDVIGNKLDRIYAELRTKGMANDGSGVWTLSAVPNEYVEHLVTLAASRSADDFHVPEERIVRFRLEEVEAQNNIMRISSRARTDDPAQVEQL